MLIPVLVLLTVFVLWAGRGGRAALSADVAAEEAAAAAALCCEEDTAGAVDREALVEDVLGARPGLEFLCVGGLRPDAPPDSGTGPEEFVREHWLDFEPGSGARTGGVGVLGVQFSCETDGAVAPLRGLFPTVTFHGQASEIVLREPPPPDIGFEQTTFSASEGPGTQLVFTVTSGTRVPEDVTVGYIIAADTTATDPSSANPPLDPADYSTVLSGTVTIPYDRDSADITVNLSDDDLYEGTEFLVLDLDPASVQPTGVAQVDLARLRAVGTIEDDDPAPYVFVSSNTSPCQVTEGDPVDFHVRLRDQSNSGPAPSADPVTVDVTTEDGTAEAANDYTALSRTTLGGNPVTFDPGDNTVTVAVETNDDFLGELTETFKVVLANANGATLGGTAEVACEILDDEVRVSIADVSEVEDTPDSTLTFEVTIDRSPTADIVLEYELFEPDPALVPHRAQQGVPPSCAAGDDYLGLASTPGMLTIRNGHNPLNAVGLDVTVCPDLVAEPDERFWLGVSVASGEAVMEPDGGAMGTIEDDDTPTITVTSAPATEGDTLEFKVSLTLNGSPANLATPVTLDYTIEEAAPVSAEEGVDYAAASGFPLTGGTLVYPAGLTGEQTVQVQLLADYVPGEGDETLVLRLSDADGANDGLLLTDASAQGIIEDDPPPVLSVSDFRGLEGTTQSFTVTLSDARAGETVTVNYDLDSGTGAGWATAPGSPNADFARVPATGALSGVLTFRSGVPGQPDILQDTIDVRLLHDGVTEVDEELRLVLSNPSRAVLFDRDPNNAIDEPYGVGTIENVASPWLIVDNVAQDEGLVLEFTVTVCNRRAGDTVTVDYRTVNRSAAAGRDYDAVSATLTFDDLSPPALAVPATACGPAAVAAQSHSVAVPTLADAIAEAAETFHLVLSDNPVLPLNAAFDKDIGVGTINNVNPASVVVRDPAPAVEGASLTFTIAVEDSTTGGDPTLNTPVTVWYVTEDRTAVAGADYRSLLRTQITFNDGSDTHAVTVQTLTDTDDEDDETFALVLSDVSSHAGIGDTEGTGTIVDRPRPGLRVEDVTAQEGGPLTFRVRLVIRDPNRGFVETPTSEPVTVTAATDDGTATEPGDYTARTQTLAFMPGNTAGPGFTSLEFTVDSIADAVPEPPETFWVELAGAQNARLDRALAKGTINPRCVNVAVDNPPIITLHDVRVGETGSANVPWTFSQPLCDYTPVIEQTFDGTAKMLFDYAPRSGGFHVQPSLTLLPMTLGTPVRILDDDLDEDDETFVYELNWNAAGTTLLAGDNLGPAFQNQPWASATVTIEDDDDEPTLTVSDAFAPEGDAMTFEVTLTPASGRTVTVQYRTVDASAVAGVDYDPLGWTTIEFVPDADSGETATSATFLVQTHADADVVDDTFWVELRAPDPADPASAPMNARIGDGVAVGTIIEGDPPTLRVHDARADENDALEFTVELSRPASQPVTVHYETVQRPAGPHSATADVDYTPAPAGASLTFGVGDPLTQTISVAALDDGVDPEADETFLLELSGAVGASLADPSAVGTINGDVSCIDPYAVGAVPPTVTWVEPQAEEGSGRMTFLLELSEPYCQSMTFQHRDWGGTATLHVDFQNPFGLTGVDAFSRDVSFDVVLIDDNIDEPDETVGVRVIVDNAHGFAAPIAAVNPVGTIVDDDETRLELPDVGDTRAEEGNSLSFVVRLDGPTEQTVRFDYETADGPAPAAAGTDYTPVHGTATIPAGDRSVTIAVRTTEDALYEFDENLELYISNLTGADPDPDGTVAVGTITDDDDPPAVSVSNPFADEGAALVFAVTLDAPAGRETSVSYSTRNGSATVGDDYADTSGTLTFNTGETAKTVSVQTLTDDATEGAEIFFLDLTSTELRFEDDTGTGTIRDVTQRRVSVSDAVVREGGALSFVVGFVGPPAGRDITVQFNTVAGTAEAGDDYSDAVESAPGVVRILSGRTSAVAQVRTVQDSLDEDLEQLRLVLSDPVGAVLAVSEAVGTIIDDDPEPLLSVDDPEATENGDGTPVVFTLRLSEESGRAVSVDYSTVDGTAKKGDDYGEAADAATILAGARTVQVSVALVNDDVVEEVERFLLLLSDPSNARFGDSSGAATIFDDDARPQILIDDAAATYEAAGASVSFAVRLSRADPDAAVTVDYATEDATATAGDDYANTSSTLTFAAGQTENTVTVDLVDDDIAEDTETFRLRLSNPSSNAVLGDDSATAAVLDDDDLPKLSVSDAPEATEGTTATFAVELNQSSTQAVTVAYAAIVDPLADAAAIPGQDFDTVAATLTIPSRSTSATVTVDLPDDTFDEHTETFWLRLADPVGAGILDGTGVGTITDDDPLPQLDIGDSGATEGDMIRFTVTLDTVSGRTVTVPWTTAPSITGDPATPTDDYVAESGTLIFPSGTTTVHIDIATVEDEVSEPDETFQVQLGQPTNAAVDDGVAVGAIVDDDDLPRLSIAGTELLETDSPATFVVTLSRTSSRPVTVDYATAEDTATAGADYGTPTGEATGTLTIPAGLDTGEISVFVADDGQDEDTETFDITLHNAVNAVIAEGAGTAVGTILDDDDPPELTIGDADAYEADGTIEFPVTLSAASANPVTVRYTTFDGSATQPDDYTAASATLTIPAQTATATIAVTLTDDHFVEDPEAFLVRLSAPTSAEIDTAEAVGVILDDDNLPVIATSDRVEVREDIGTVVVEVTLGRASDRVVSVDYGTARNSTLGTNCPSIVNQTGTLTFAPGDTARTITVEIVSDPGACTYQGDPYYYVSFLVQLSNPVNAVLSPGFGRVTQINVWDVQYLPVVRFGPGWHVTESAGEAQFTFRLSYIHDQDVIVEYTVTELSATAGVDYANVTGGTITIPAGQREATLNIAIIDDSDVEETETFRLKITGVTNGRRILQYKTMQIIDDDSVSIEVHDVEVGEGIGSAMLTVALDRVSDNVVTVDYETSDGSATSPDDYTPVDGTLTFSVGETHKLVAVPLVDDEVAESDETFDFVLDNAAGAAISSSLGSATVTISDDDGSLPIVTLADYRNFESGSGFGFELTLTLSEPSTQDVMVTWRYIEATWLGDRAADSSDYGGYNHPSGYIQTIPAGDTSKYLRVYPVDDNIPEHDERFIVALYDPVGVIIGTQHAWVTIIDDDLPVVSVADQSVSEDGDAIQFELELHEPGVVAARVDYATVVRSSEGDAAAIPGQDYTHTSGTATFAPGVGTATVTVPLIGDNIDEELYETFLLELSNPELLVLGDSSALGTIIDDDPGWAINDRGVWEDAASMVFTVTRDHTSTSAVTLNYTVTGASAAGGDSCTAGVDYITPSGSVTLLPAETQAEISLTVCDDDVLEGSETLLIQLTGVPGRKLTGTGTIVDNDSD